MSKDCIQCLGSNSQANIKEPEKEKEKKKENITVHGTTNVLIHGLSTISIGKALQKICSKSYMVRIFCCCSYCCYCCFVVVVVVVVVV